jgi:hypothetical protein
MKKFPRSANVTKNYYENTVKISIVPKSCNSLIYIYVQSLRNVIQRVSNKIYYQLARSRAYCTAVFFINLSPQTLNFSSGNRHTDTQYYVYYHQTWRTHLPKPPLLHQQQYQVVLIIVMLLAFFITEFDVFDRDGKLSRFFSEAVVNMGRKSSCVLTKIMSIFVSVEKAI